MKSVVIYESAYGNTKEVAETIAGVLAEYGSAEAVTAAAARDRIEEVDLLVVGCPTHAWGLPRRRTWPAKDAAPVPSALLRSWLGAAPRGRGRPAAAFATRLGGSRWVTGSAAGGVARRLARRGWQVIGRRSFVVVAMAGPLSAGEVEAAGSWARELAAAASQTMAVTNRS